MLSFEVDGRPHPVSDMLTLGIIEHFDVVESVLTGPDATQAMDLIRSMIERVVLRPKALGKGLDLELYGELANILAACAGAKMQNAPGSKASGRLSVVAGTGFEPVTFRL